MKILIEYQDQFGKWLHYSTMNHQTIALKTAQNRAKNNRQEATTNISEDDDDEELGICSWSVYIYKSAIELISNRISTLPNRDLNRIAILFSLSCCAMLFACAVILSLLACE